MRPDPAPLNPALAGSRSSDLGGALKRQALVILACVVIGAALGFVYTKLANVTYESRATVLLEPLPGETAPGGGRDRTLDVETQATVARSTALLQTVGERLDLTAVQVKDKSRVVAAPLGNVLYIYYEDDEDTIAAQGALVYTEEFLALRKANADNEALRQKQLLTSQIEDLQLEIDQLTTQIQDTIDRQDVGSSTELEVLQQRLELAISNVASLRNESERIDTDQTPGRVIVDPRTAVNQTGLDKKFTIAGGAFVGLLVGVVLALLRDRRDDRYGSALGRDALGIHEIGAVRQPAAQRSARGDAVRRGYARLVVRLSLASGGAGSAHRSVMIVAVESTTMPANTSHAVATALVDEGPDNGIDARLLQSEAGPTLVEGEATPTWDHFASVLEGTRQQADVVFVTALSLDRSAAALAIAPRVDQVVLLVSPATKVGDLQAAIDDVNSVDARDVSVLVVRRAHGLR